LRRAGIIALLIVAAVPLLLAVSQLPTEGSITNPSYTHVVPRYLEEGKEEAGSSNIVTTIILNYRGFDTNGEVTVIFTALIAVSAILLTGSLASGEAEPKERRWTLPISPVVAFVVRVIAPFTAIFSIYMIVRGHGAPGGGFQGGTILGSLAILLSIVLGRKQAIRLLPNKTRPLLQGAAVLAFIVVGIIGLFLSGAYLQFPQEHSLELVRELELLTLEIGIGLGGAAIVASLFWALEGHR